MTNNDKARFTLRMPTKLYDEVQKKSNEIGLTRNAFIVQILWTNLKEKEVK